MGDAQDLLRLADDLLAALEDLLADCGDTMSDGYVENSIHSDQVNAARAVVARAHSTKETSNG